MSDAVGGTSRLQVSGMPVALPPDAWRQLQATDWPMLRSCGLCVRIDLHAPLPPGTRVRLRVCVMRDMRVLAIEPRQIVVAHTTNYFDNRPTYPRPAGAYEFDLPVDRATGSILRFMYLPTEPGRYDVYVSPPAAMLWGHVTAHAQPADALALSPDDAREADAIAARIIGV